MYKTHCYFCHRKQIWQHMLHFCCFWSSSKNQIKKRNIRYLHSSLYIAVTFEADLMWKEHPIFWPVIDIWRRVFLRLFVQPVPNSCNTNESFCFHWCCINTLSWVNTLMFWGYYMCKKIKVQNFGMKEIDWSV